MKKVLTMGEIMLRLKTKGNERFFQSPEFEATFGGGEANVAVSLANYKMPVEFLSVLPDNQIGDECIAELRRRRSSAKTEGWASTIWRPVRTSGRVK